MRVLILVSCVIAAASAGFVHSPAAVAYTTGYVGYTGAQHVPVIGANGVPVEPAANQAARAAHAAAHVEAKARNGDVVVGPAVAYTAYPAAHVGYVAHAQHVPVIGANGVPVEPAANQAARAAHAAAHVEAKARNGDVAVVGPAVAYAAYPTTVVTAAGVAETPEVVAAKAAHFKAHAEAKARNLGVAVGYVAPYSGYNTVYGYSYPYYGTAIGPNGVPLEPAENVAARAAHAAAHVEAKVRNGVLVRRRRGFASTYYSPYAAVPAVTYAGAQHVPVIGANGVPVEPAVNQAARAAHAAAHVEAVARNGDAAVVVGAPTVYAAGHAFYAGAQHLPVIGANGVPVEPAANQAARAAHAAAHVEAKARNGDVVVAPAVAYSAHPAVAYTTGAVGVPADTPEVAAAKVAHFQAHVNAKIAAGVY